jgi:sulfatase maturation enzyme AslB (radical SAM superfamily)
MSIEKWSLPVSEKELERFTASSNAVVIRSIREYRTDDQGNLEPVFGAPIGLWHQVNGSFVAVQDRRFWQLWEQLSAGGGDCYELVSPDETNTTIYSLNGTISKLRAKGFLAVNGREQITHLQDQHLSAEAYVHLTEMCNLSCVGCCTLSDQRGGAGAESMDTTLLHEYLEHAVRGAVAKGYKKFTFKWAGGEPTLPAPFAMIEAAQALIQSLQERYPSIKLTQTILSNGIPLNERKISFLHEHGIHVVISFWGLDTDNDLQRRPRNKQKTFERIQENIRTCVRKGVKFNVLTVIKPENADAFADVIRFLWDKKDPGYIFAGCAEEYPPIPISINFYRPQNDLEHERVLAEQTKIVNGLRAGFDEILRLICEEDVPISIPEMWDYLNLTAPFLRTCGSGLDYFSISHNGISSCHEETAVDHRDRIERMREGENLLDLAAEDYHPDDLPLLRADKRVFRNQDEVKLALHGGGGCPRSRKDADGRILPYAAQLYNPYTAIWQELLTIFLLEKQRMSKKDNIRVVQVRQDNCIGCPGDSRCGLHLTTTALPALQFAAQDTRTIIGVINTVLTAVPGAEVHVMSVNTNGNAGLDRTFSGTMPTEVLFEASPRMQIDFRCAGYDGYNSETDDDFCNDSSGVKILVESTIAHTLISFV